jgi:hypothetical protein
MIYFLGATIGVLHETSFKRLHGCIISRLLSLDKALSSYPGVIRRVICKDVILIISADDIIIVFDFEFLAKGIAHLRHVC